MNEKLRDQDILTTSNWKATPSVYSSLRTLHFDADGTGQLTYGYGQSIYAIIKCRWFLPVVGTIELAYLESPSYQHFQGFVPDLISPGKSIHYKLVEGEVQGIVSVIARPYRYQWTLEFSGSVYPEGLELPYGSPLVFHGHPLPKIS